MGPYQTTVRFILNHLHPDSVRVCAMHEWLAVGLDEGSQEHSSGLCMFMPNSDQTTSKDQNIGRFYQFQGLPPKKWWLGLWKGLPYELNLGVCISWSINPWKKQVFQLWGGGSACWDEESRSAPAGRCTEETRDLATGGKDVSSTSIKQSITIQSNPGIVIKWPNKCHQFLASSGMEQQLDDLTIL